MASFADILLRADAVLTKYSHYEEIRQSDGRNSAVRSEDPFSDKYFEIMERVQELNLKASSISGEKNRALRAALNAELRKEKASLWEALKELQGLVRGRRVPPDVERERLERLEEAQQAVAELPDGTPGGSVLTPQRSAIAQSAPSGKSSRRIDIGVAGVGSMVNKSGAYQHTEQTAEFVREATMARDRQDLALENIERGVSTLKDLGHAMGEELERHDVLIDEVGSKMEAVTGELQTNNMKLKGLVTQVRSTRRFFIDIILAIVLLALGLYIYNMLS